MSSEPTTKPVDMSHEGTHQAVLPNTSRLIDIMAQLRDPQHGCPWDLNQSFESIVPYTIEEAYEVADAIENGSMEDVRDELGDLLFQVIFYAQLGHEQSEFDFEAIAKTIGDKLVRRHPHIFAQKERLSEQQIKQNWALIKHQERQLKGDIDDLSILAHVPAGMAPITRAEKLQKRCASVGFDWPDIAPVFDKVQEEIIEVQEELVRQPQDPLAVEEEIGDLMFAVINLARHAGVDAERALRSANHKFEHRFRQVECALSAQGNTVAQATLEDMEMAWQAIKQAK